MNRILWMPLLFATVASSALAQSGAPALDETQQQGRLLFQQSCGICHTHPTITAPLYGPALSRTSVESGRDVQARQFISDGTPNMPGFKHNFSPTQIDSIIAYLKTVTPPAPAPAAAPAPTPAR